MNCRKRCRLHQHNPGENIRNEIKSALLPYVKGALLSCEGTLLPYAKKCPFGQYRIPQGTSRSPHKIFEALQPVSLHPLFPSCSVNIGTCNAKCYVEPCPRGFCRSEKPRVSTSSVFVQWKADATCSSRGVASRHFFNHRGPDAPMDGPPRLVDMTRRLSDLTGERGTRCIYFARSCLASRILTINFTRSNVIVTKGMTCVEIVRKYNQSNMKGLRYCSQCLSIEDIGQ